MLTLLPDFWDPQDRNHNRDRDRDHDVIALTHVCRAWRELFISRSSLWTNFYCVDPDKTHTYLERSKSSPINLSLSGHHGLSSSDPFLQIVPHAIKRLKSLSIKVVSETLPDIIAHLSLPAPHLEHLSIDGDCESAPQRNPVLTSTLFNGALSSLRELCLKSVRTELPWKNMVNLTSFTLAHTLPGEICVRYLLNFFESAPRLREVHLRSTTPTSGAQDGRSVSLTNLKWMTILGSGPTSLLLNHLLIPVGATLITQADLSGPLIEDHLPKSLDNLRNLSGFSEIRLYVIRWYPRVRFSGPNGQVTMVPITFRMGSTHLVLESLTRFDTSKVKRMEIEYGERLCEGPSSRDLPYQALLPMKSLRTLTLSACQGTHTFISALHPSTSSEDVVCPELEELVLALPMDRAKLNIEAVIEMAATRASRGAKLKSVRIVSCDEAMKAGALELRKHVLRVRCGPDARRDG